MHIHWSTYNTVHVQVQVVELFSVGVRVGHEDRNCDFIAVITGDFRGLRLYDGKNCVWIVNNTPATEETQNALIFGYFLLSQRKSAGTPYNRC